MMPMEITPLRQLASCRTAFFLPLNREQRPQSVMKWRILMKTEWSKMESRARVGIAQQTTCPSVKARRKNLEVQSTISGYPRFTALEVQKFSNFTDRENSCLTVSCFCILLWFFVTAAVEISNYYLALL